MTMRKTVSSLLNTTLPRLRAAAVAALVVLAVAAAARADRVITKAGETFNGTIVEEDATKVVLKMLSGTMTFQRDNVKAVEKAGAAPEVKPGAPAARAPAAAPVAVTIAKIEPADAPAAFKSAKSALVSGEWAKAAGLFEGLMLLDGTAFSVADRLPATGALMTCYLQLKDNAGAARALARRGQLATDANDRVRLMAASEMVRLRGAVSADGKALSAYDDVMQAAMEWKASAVLAEAKDAISKIQQLNNMAVLEKGVNLAVKKLESADVYVSGFSAAHRKELVAAVVQSILDVAKETIAALDPIRQDLTTKRLSSTTSRPAAKAFNEIATAYFNRRLGAESALKNLKPFTTKMGVPELYTANAGTVTDALAQLDDYLYYPKGTNFPMYGYYSYTSPYDSNGRVRIVLRQFGN